MPPCLPAFLPSLDLFILRFFLCQSLVSVRVKKGPASRSVLRRKPWLRFMWSQEFRTLDLRCSPFIYLVRKLKLCPGSYIWPLHTSSLDYYLDPSKPSPYIVCVHVLTYMGACTRVCCTWPYKGKATSLPPDSCSSIMTGEIQYLTHFCQLRTYVGDI